MFIKKFFRHVGPILNKYKWWVVSTLLFFAFAMFFDYVLKSFLLKEIIDLISAPMMTEREASLSSIMHFFWLTAFTLIGVYVFNRLATWTHTYFKNNMLRELSNYSFMRITAQSYGFFTNNFAGGLVSKSKRFTSGFRNISNTFYFNFWNTFIIILFALIILFREESTLAFILLCWVIIYLGVSISLAKIKFKYDLRASQADSRVGGRLADVFTNIFALKVFSSNNYEMNSFRILTDDEATHRGKNWNITNMHRAVKGIFMVSAQILVLFFSIKIWLAGDMTTGTFVLVQTYMLTVISRLWDLDDALVGFMESLSEMNEAMDIFDKPLEIQDPVVPEKLRIKEGQIYIENISFEYVENLDVFENFSLQIKASEKVGLVGHSGSGKSTITKMLLRFVEVKRGSITIDGQNVRNITQDDLRSVISYVPQDPILFHRSIAENIGYSKSDATREEIEEAAKKAHAHEFIKDLPNGYDTLVGERGVKLSGGERQRVAIARAMLKDAPILILDEATSSLDSISETYIQEAFAELMKGKTTIVIAHRLSTIQKMDRILVLDKGQIIEEGSHKELLEKGGTYEKLWNHQTGGFLE